MAERLYTVLLGFCSSACTALAANSVSLELAGTPPSGISGYVDPSFAGFGIEPSNLFSFTGMEEPNELTFTLINNLINFTGRPPHIRVGGNTADYMVFDKAQFQWNWVLNETPRGRGNFKPNHMVIGPRIFEATNRFPQGTPVTWGLNLAYDEPDWGETITTMAEQVIAGLTDLELVSLEIGNEPDLYLQNGFRTGEWGGRVYTEEWLQRARVIWEQVLKPNNIPANVFEVANTASTIGTDFQVKDLMSFGIDTQPADSNTNYIASWNQHDYFYFFGVSTYPLTLEYLMKLATTEAQFLAWTEQIEQARVTDYPYALREMGIVGPIGMAGVTDVFGAALWTLNFLLYAASLGITSVQFHMTDNSNASAWQPIAMYGREPFVRPLYYGIAAFDQTIGPTCTAQVSRLKTSCPSEYDEFLRAYTIYHGGHLTSVAVINGKMANISELEKASVEISIAVPSSLSGTELHLSYLTSDGADATNGTTWNGISFEQSGDGSPTRVADDSTIVKVGSDGNIRFFVRDSQAVVANIGKRVGEGLERDPAACAAKKTSPAIEIQPPESNKGSDSHEDAESSATILGSSIGGLLVCIATVMVFLDRRLVYMGSSLVRLV
ncbi:hypothetical protein DL766_002879 [Monosporascus sp. MC13-8B]|uniref:Beta-glucuronidase C-terminal domain-containing protein n=1 Tax=Monosporascus cannonballus TaxID=155416 RepID=A0ABY0H797_9PEZI|nr:hypothetical protein DL762_004591 [Monosporascus cannonballus]RYO96276.1 hypothetical protein DL763_003303 [Monosporascus cannonballus]RYP34660.1 hypothetical protein DL766_002879 [Monosporascus sp. MC13-8B]